MSETQPDLNVIEMAAEIVSAYVRNNSVPVGELPTLLQSVHEALGGILTGAKPEAPKEPLQPKVPVKKSVTTEYIICLEDGSASSRSSAICIPPMACRRRNTGRSGVSRKIIRWWRPPMLMQGPIWLRRWASVERPAPCRPSKCPSPSPS